MLKIALIGTGGHSRIHHGEPCRLLGDRIDRAAVCSLNADEAAAFAREFGFRQSFTDVERMIAEVRPDALIAVTPVGVNFAMAKRLIPLGIPLLMEKPPGETAVQAAELLALAEAHGNRVMVSFNRRFAPPLQRLRDWRTARPELPPPTMLRASMFRVARCEPEFVMATAIHSLDAIIALMGEPEHVVVNPLPGVRNSLIARLDFTGGATGVFTLHPQTGLVVEEYELSGLGWQVRAEINRGAFAAWLDGRQTDEFRIDPAESETCRSGAIAETASFIDRVERGLPFEPDLRHGVAVMRLAETLQQAVDAAGKGY